MPNRQNQYLRKKDVLVKNVAVRMNPTAVAYQKKNRQKNQMITIEAMKIIWESKKF
jgi:hypothetical protein